MFLTYKTYLKAIAALNDYCKGKVKRSVLQDAVFNHYARIEGDFVAENKIKSKRLFTYCWNKSRRLREERKSFRKFMKEKADKKYVK